jgi:hypothetical protein
LLEHCLVSDDVRLIRDKSILFDYDYTVQDAIPVTLEKAVRTGPVRTGLTEPRNTGTDSHPSAI